MSRRVPNEVVLRSEGAQVTRPSDSGTFLSGAHGVTVSGGELSNVQGHHIVINVNPQSSAQGSFRSGITSNAPSISPPRNTRTIRTNIVRGGRSRVPEPENFASSQLPVQQSNVVYQRHLELKGYGFPLWIPQANQNLPKEYRRTGVRIGDVGIITPNGGFSFLFNICLPHDHPVNQQLLPEHFSPIFEVTNIDKFSIFGRSSHLASTSVRKAQANSQSLGFHFESSAPEGAILIMPPGAYAEALGNVASFRRYAASNMVHWYKFVNDVLGREAKNGDIRLVVGCVKTTSWGIATFANQARQSSCHLTFRPLEVPSSDSIFSDSSQYVWEYSGIAEVKDGPSPGDNNGLREVDDPGDIVCENQCLFLRTLNATLSDNIWSEIHCDPNSGGLQLQSDLHPAKGSASTPSSANSTSATKGTHSTLSSRKLGNRRSLGPYSALQNNIIAFDDKPSVLDSDPLPTPISHLSNALNDMLMAMVPAARMVITDDDDWSSVASKYDTLPDPHELLEHILVSHCICEEDGVIFLDRRDAIESGVSNAQELVPGSLEAKALSVPPTQSSRGISLPYTITPSRSALDNSLLTSSADRSNVHEALSPVPKYGSKPSIVNDVVSTNVPPFPTTTNISSRPLIFSDNIMSSSDSADSIEISDITIKSSIVIAKIKLSIGSTFRRTILGLAADKSKEVTLSLEPARPSLPFLTPLIIRVHQEGLLNRPKKIEIKHWGLLSNAGTVDADTNKREYRTTVDGIEVIMRFILQTSCAHTNPRSTVDEIFELCPRFRILVIGRTGAGKTSLIVNTFGVRDTLISHNEVGECDINKELSSSDENKRFVLHDSKGFEPGDRDNFDTVIKFLNERKMRPDVKDQVHAVWLCFTIPIASDRLLEKGAENFLQLLSEGKLGRMPVIAIFTKYDRLVNHLRIHISGDFAGLDENALQEKVDHEAKANMEKLCFKPFREQTAGMNWTIPEIAVSTKEEYRWTLQRLTQLTTQFLGKYLTEDIALLSAVAQRVSPTVKLDAVISVGKKRWQGLGSTLNLFGNGPAIVLQNIHQDIVRIWNMQDPNELLESPEFSGLVAAMFSEQDVPPEPMMTTSRSVLRGVVSAVSGPFKQAAIVLQRQMNYIVALTLILQIIFAITTSTNDVVSRRSIKLALKTFHDSSQKHNIHSAIKEHFKRPGSHFDRDAALAKIAELIRSNGVVAEEMAEIKTMMRDFDIGNDETWDLHEARVENSVLSYKRSGDIASTGYYAKSGRHLKVTDRSLG